MTIRKFKIEIEGLFKGTGVIDLDEADLNITSSALGSVIISKPDSNPEKQSEIIDKRVNIQKYGIQPIDSQLEGLEFKGCFNPETKRLTEDGYWVGYDTEVFIIKIKNGVQTKEPVMSVIGSEEFNKLDLSEIDLYIPKGTYILLQGHGMNALWYQKAKSISGEGTLIGINSHNNSIFNKINTKVEGLTLKNIIIDSSPNKDENQLLKNLTIHLNPLERSRNPITVDSLNSTIVAEDVTIDTEADLRAGFYIDHAKKVSIKNSIIKANYADNGIRVSRVLETCELIGNTSGKGFNTAFQASANREALSIGYKFDRNTVNEVLEEGAGFDSYANSMNLIPVISKFYISSASKVNDGVLVEIDSLYFINEIIPGKKYQNKKVDADFVGDPRNYLLVLDNEYKDFKIISSEPFNDGNSLKILIEGDYIPSKGTEGSLVTGFYKCSISENWINGVVPKTNQPGHALSLWGGGFYNVIKGNTVNGGRSGLNMASLGAFGVESPDYFCHAIGNIIEKNKIHKTQNAFRITSEYSRRKGYANQFIDNEIYEGEFLINNQLEFQMRGNILSGTIGLIENVEGTMEGGQLIDSIITIKNSPNLKIGDIDLIGSSKINRV
ncbi:hypothetical protein PBT90_03960 [Algoriphagus halophytocola]|uniref:Gp5/Type VI secretion system Vgr protein OB-fold domain-containing protein n=1 Tax=Algoriphagus halophytocola TaxID=2991499 RepID=A0ABY6MH94_9BACT|nr:MULTISPECIES: hypothetical protein [unclassified Algoriphagus]UZD22573.1 hypothetical protein OM944_18220 [Algoriphagus sp. TR-M5]WBL43839.1 hypothetical protein PBT90_03960 [Algoriphagus sp. TR-M9]